MSALYKHEEILRLCDNKRVLHIGAVDYPFHSIRGGKDSLLHQRLQKVSKDLIGIDINKKAIRDLKRYNIKNIFYGDIVEAKYDSIVKKNKYDIIVFGDVIEHLDNPGIALKNIAKLMSKKSILILTTPNVFNLANLINIFSKKEIVHSDHIFWPSRKTMDNLIIRSSLKIKKFQFVFSGSKKDPRTCINVLLNNIIFKLYRSLCPVLFYEIMLK